MGMSERRKGKAGEREVAKLFEAGGFSGAKRSGDAGQPDGDLDHVGPFYVEVRRRERLALPAWIKEVEAESPAHLTPIIAFRQSNMAWQVALRLEAFIEHIRSADVSR